MVNHVVIDSTAEAHRDCVKCEGTKTHGHIVSCCNKSCKKITHVKCQPTHFVKNYATFPAWFCSPACGKNDNVITLDATIQVTSLKNSETTKGEDPPLPPKSPHKSFPESQFDRIVAAQQKQIVDLTTALQNSIDIIKKNDAAWEARFSVLDNNNKMLKSQLASAMVGQSLGFEPDKTSNPHSAHVTKDSASTRDEKISIAAAQALHDFQAATAPLRSEIECPRADSLSENRSAPKVRDSTTNMPAFPENSSSYHPTTDGCSSATLVARERVRSRRLTDKSFSSRDVHATLSHKDLSRLKLARQNFDEIMKFKGDHLEWLAFEEEVYTTWDGGEYNDYEMIKKLRKALDGDAKNYVKLALNAPEANPEYVMETLRRKYYHPNDAVARALREIYDTDPVRKKVRRPLEDLMSAVENYIHICNLVKIQQHLHGRVQGEVEAKLPPDMHADWNKLIRTTSYTDGRRFIGTWVEFWRFLRDTVEDLPVEETSTNFK